MIELQGFYYVTPYKAYEIGSLFCFKISFAMFLECKC